MAHEGFLSGFFRRTRAAAGRAPLTSEQQIRDWMAERLAAKLEISVAEVDTSKRFDEYGLDSRTAVQVSGELEKLVERRLSPALLIEHPTIDSVAKEIARELSGAEQEARGGNSW
jgi:acyl carrier protein